MDSATLKEIVVSSGAVMAILAVMVYIGMTYGDEQGVLTNEGGQALAMAIAGFVVMLSVIGYTRKYWLGQ
ncbi:DUF7472 family protein [Haloarchaeobius sp. DFWS5]|uniref:DUF7472 family protein n=1 Tax=Haloarchaeobius sp. DFWS5 TaxID=3446114 RepID=UPI003EBDED35